MVFDASWFSFIPYIGFRQIAPMIDGPYSCNNGQYIKNIAKWLDKNDETKGTILLWYAGPPQVLWPGNPNLSPMYTVLPEKLRDFLVGLGYKVELTVGLTPPSYLYLSKYSQIWIIDGSVFTEDFSSPEFLDALAEYYKDGGNILLSGECGDCTTVIESVAQRLNLGVDASCVLFTQEEISGDKASCLFPNFTVEHPLTEEVWPLGTSGTDVIFTITNPNVKTIATVIDVWGVEHPYILVLDPSSDST